MAIAQKRRRSTEQGLMKQWTKTQLKALEDALLEFGEHDVAHLRCVVWTRLLLAPASLRPSSAILHIAAEQMQIEPWP